MKTPEQIATEAMYAFTFVDPDHAFGDDSDVEERDWFYIRDQIKAAIEADRAQRDEDEVPEIFPGTMSALCRLTTGRSGVDSASHRSSSQAGLSGIRNGVSQVGTEGA